MFVRRRLKCKMRFAPTSKARSHFISFFASLRLCGKHFLVFHQRNDANGQRSWHFEHTGGSLDQASLLNERANQLALAYTSFQSQFLQ